MLERARVRSGSRSTETVVNESNARRANERRRRRKQEKKRGFSKSIEFLKRPFGKQGIRTARMRLR
jgi:hypothetical protein